MTVQEESRLSFYQKIAEISDHKNVVLVQHRDTRQVYVRKDLTVYDARVYRYLMEHPSRYFPQIYECIESDGTLTVIEEYIQGQNLEERLEEEGCFSEEETVRITEEICEALKLLHEQSPPMIHRDLKPSNVLLDKDGQVKIVDFDAARNFDEEKDTDTVVMGTRRYAAPEQYGYAQTDARTDIYALGVMMNRMVTGQYPSEARCEGALGPVIATCIELDPAQRYQSVEALQEALQASAQDDESDQTDENAQADESAQTDESAQADESAQTDESAQADAGAPADGKRTLAARYPYLPPGFRTLTTWKMFLALVVYVLYIGSCLMMPMDTSNAAVLWVNRIFALAIGILCIFFWFNYLDVHQYLPLMKQKRWKWLGYIVYTAIIVFVLVLILMIVESFL